MIIEKRDYYNHGKIEAIDAIGRSFCARGSVYRNQENGY